MMEVHSFYCDVCNKEFDESQLMTLNLPVWCTNDATADYYQDERFRRPTVFLKKLDICDDCLVESTNLQKVKTKDGDFIKVSPCPEDAKVIIKKYSSETTTRHEKVVKKGRDAS